jgi:hypothetical protein
MTKFMRYSRLPLLKLFVKKVEVNLSVTKYSEVFRSLYSALKGFNYLEVSIREEQSSRHQDEHE